MTRIVVGIDGSPPSVAALRWAVADAARRGAHVQAWHAWHAAFEGGSGAPPDERALEQQARRTLDEAVAAAGADGVEPVLVRAVPASALLDAARGADLLVVGHGGDERAPLGSVGQQVLRNATCPVVVVPPGWDSR